LRNKVFCFSGQGVVQLNFSHGLSIVTSSHKER
jgi:hypothetical protein